MPSAAATPYFWLQPLVTAVAALLVLLGAGVTVFQRYRADRKEQWWKRTQWALDLFLTRDDDAVIVGLAVLRLQMTARVADREDATLAVDVITPLVDSFDER